jgi:hypothetical protein
MFINLLSQLLTKLPNVPMQGILTMHLNFSHMAILISYQLA